MEKMKYLPMNIARCEEYADRFKNAVDDDEREKIKNELLYELVGEWREKWIEISGEKTADELDAEDFDEIIHLVTLLNDQWVLASNLILTKTQLYYLPRDGVYAAILYGLIKIILDKEED